MSPRNALFVLSLSVYLVGCSTVPASKFSSFSDSADSINESADATFQQVRSTVLQNMVVSAPDGVITATTFQPPTEKNIAGKTVVPIFDYMNTISNAFDVVDKYAKALNVLAGSGSPESIDKAATSLAASLNSFSKKVPGVTVGEGNAVATLADGIGQLATYEQRKDGLIKVLNLGQPALVEISAGITRDTPNFLKYIDGLEANYLTYANQARKEYKQFTEQRFNFDNQTAQQLTTFDNIRGAVKALQQAAEKLPATNQDLLNSVKVEGSNIDNLKAFVESARDLRSFYASLPTK